MTLDRASELPTAHIHTQSLSLSTRHKCLKHDVNVLHPVHQRHMLWVCMLSVCLLCLFKDCIETCYMSIVLYLPITSVSHFFKFCLMALGPPSLLGAPFLGVKRPGREADHSLPSSAEVKNALSCISTPQYTFMAWPLSEAQGQLYLYLFTLIYFINLRVNLVPL